MYTRQTTLSITEYYRKIYQNFTTSDPKDNFIFNHKWYWSILYVKSVVLSTYLSLIGVSDWVLISISFRFRSGLLQLLKCPQICCYWRPEWGRGDISNVPDPDLIDISAEITNWEIFVTWFILSNHLNCLDYQIYPYVTLCYQTQLVLVGNNKSSCCSQNVID